MFPSEPIPTAVLLTIVGGLLGLSAILSRLLGRIGIPVVVLFLLLGMAAGSEGIGGIDFEDYDMAFRVGAVALAFILFDGGLNTPYSVVRVNLAPAGVLATIGVMLTAALVAMAARALGFAWTEAFLLGAVVSSTDAAAVFSVLRGSGLHLKQRIGGTLELESGVNDPMAVILTLSTTQIIIGPGKLGPWIVAQVLIQLVVGAGLGVAIGFLGRWLLRTVHPYAGGMYPILTLSIACVAFGVPTLCHGSGFIAVYITGLVLGNSRLPYRTGLIRVHDFLAWFAQVTMFLGLGLLVFPSQLLGVVGPGLGIAAFLALVARPLAIFICLLPFGYSAKEVLYIGWVGLRGAVPIILAAFPIMAGVEGGMRIFNVVFFVVVLSATIQGGTVKWVTRRAGLQTKAPPPPPALLEITSMQLLDGEIHSYFIYPASAASGAAIAELPFPADAAAMLIVRGKTLIAPRGPVRLQPSDHVYVFCRAEDRPLMRLLFGMEEPED
jgi:potassium/hydrogen antiporter